VILSFTELEKYLQSLEEEIAPPIAKGSVKGKSMPATDTKKRKGSQGMEKLKKANVNGMAKLSTFFSKKT
jgi:ribonuclease H2 subunit B